MTASVSNKYSCIGYEVFGTDYFLYVDNAASYYSVGLEILLEGFIPSNCNGYYFITAIDTSGFSISTPLPATPIPLFPTSSILGTVAIPEVPTWQDPSTTGIFWV